MRTGSIMEAVTSTGLGRIGQGCSVLLLIVVLTYPGTYCYTDVKRKTFSYTVIQYEYNFLSAESMPATIMKTLRQLLYNQA